MKTIKPSSKKLDCFFPIPLFSLTFITGYVSLVVLITSGVFSWQHFLCWGPTLFARLHFCEYKESKPSYIGEWNLRKKLSIYITLISETKKGISKLVIWLLMYIGYKICGKSYSHLLTTQHVFFWIFIKV